MRSNTAALRAAALAFAAMVALAQGAAQAQGKKYGPGVSDSEIKIGQSTPFSGPASAFGIYSRVEQAYFNAVNEKGGINGRKVKFIMLDNGFSPPKALEASRKLVEEENVLAEVGTVGTPTNSATQRYLNGKKVPQLIVSAGGSKFNDPRQYPWTVPFYPSFEVEAIGFTRYALKAQQAPKIAVLYQNDDYGKDFLKGLKKALGEANAKLLVAEQSYELTDPTVDSQMISLAGSGANIFMSFTTPKFAAQAIRKADELKWKPMQFIASPGSSVQAVLKVAGFDKSEGVMTAQYFKEPGDPA
jgi:branched-chain amino acid transport system substrate-binding protein